MGMACSLQQKNKKINKNFVFTTIPIKHIKSNYIINNIFSFLFENKKLELIKYSKKYQRRLDIDIKYYKQISRKYIIGERNGKGKEFDYDDNLIFEGEYKNGKRNGEGKEYYDDGKGRVKFEGRYLNGKKLQGLIYNKSGSINLLEGIKGKEYYLNHKLKFEGEYFNGKNGMENFIIKMVILFMK